MLFCIENPGRSSSRAPYLVAFSPIARNLLAIFFTTSLAGK